MIKGSLDPAPNPIIHWKLPEFIRGLRLFTLPLILCKLHYEWPRGKKATLALASLVAAFTLAIEAITKWVATEII
jgi:hypothetical protein